MSANSYGKVLFELCKESNCLDVVLDDFTKFIEAMDKEPSWLSIINSPVLNNKEKKNLLKGLASFNPIFLNFLYLLLDERSINDYNNIYKKFYYELMKSKQIAEIKIVSKEKLSKEKMNKIMSSLSMQLPNMDLKIIENLDENLLGGVKIFYEDEIIDHSFLGILKEMKEKV